MKTSSVNAVPEPPSVQMARGCAATNVALPCFGSLMAKRGVGWAQAILTSIGFVLTMVFGVHAIMWFARNYSTIYSPEADPVETLRDTWLNIRWALLGVGLFGISWLWAAATNISILRAAKQSAERAKPPVLK